ncbi:MAG: hypothetical protein J0J15_25040 [Mesorhizobium sp.]|nr:hypothetical protein [Mesorhizobium sp.]
MSGSKTDMRTPLGKVRGLGSAREGTGHFWHQRLTAIANVPLMLFFVGFLIALNTFFTVAVGVASLFALLKLAFGG